MGNEAGDGQDIRKLAELNVKIISTYLSVKTVMSCRLSQDFELPVKVHACRSSRSPTFIVPSPHSDVANVF